MSFTHGHALVIGVGTYQYEPHLNIPIAAADAQAVADVVCNGHYCGYPTGHVTPLWNAEATRDNILSALDNLAQTNTNATVLLFYSGHGHYSADQTYYLTTHDTRLDGKWIAPGSAISQAELLQKLRAIKAERVLLLFNTCHAGEVSPVLGSGNDTISFTGQNPPEIATTALLSTGTGRIIITSCRENQVSFVGSGSLSIFTQALINGLQGQGLASKAGYISAFDLYTHIYFSVGSLVERTVSQATRDTYGSKQEPELTVLKGVGPFAVALYRGATTLGTFTADHTPAEGTAVRYVEPNYSQWALQQQSIQQTVSGTGSIGIVGPVTDSTITAGSDNTVTQSGRDTIHVGRDMNQIRGDYVDDKRVDARGTKSFINQPSGPIMQNLEDTVSGDKISGNINVSGISGQNVTVGHKSQVQMQMKQDNTSGVSLARLFEPIYQQIDTLDDPDVIKGMLNEHVQKIVSEVQRGYHADTQQIEGWLVVIARMAPDIQQNIVYALLNPNADVATTIKKIAEKVMQARGQM